MMTLREIREELDAVDDAIVELLVRRFRLLEEVVEAKRRELAAPHDPAREKAILSRVDEYMRARSVPLQWRESIVGVLGEVVVRGRRFVEAGLASSSRR